MKIEISPKEYERRLNWYDAIFYCQLLVIDDKIDWRLPTKDELEDIFYNYENDLLDSGYWSSTEYDSDFAWGQVFSDGFQVTLKKYGIINVRAVRNLSI